MEMAEVNLETILSWDIRALSIREPYASMMLHGKKETRGGRRNYRGWVLLCASKKSFNDIEIIQISGHGLAATVNKKSKPEKYKSGMAYAIGYLYDCQPMKPEDEEAAFVTYKPGLWCLSFKNVRAIKPFHYNGNITMPLLGDDIKSKIAFCNGEEV